MALSRESLACLPVAEIASLAKAGLGQRHIFRRLDSLPVHDTHIEASRPITGITCDFEDLPSLEHILGNAFSEKITFAELSAAASKPCCTALLEKNRSVLEVTADSLPSVIERPEHEATPPVSMITGFAQNAVPVSLHNVHQTPACVFRAEITSLL